MICRHRLKMSRPLRPQVVMVRPSMSDQGLMGYDDDDDEIPDSDED